MKVPPKRQWRAAASSGDPQRAVDDSYATAWTAEAADRPWFEIDLGAVATLGGLEVYWGERAPANYRFASSLDGEGVVRVLPHAPWRGRTGRIRLPPGRGAVRSLDQRGLAGRARAGDRRDQPLRSRGGRLGARGGPARRAGPRRREGSRRREHYGRLRRRAVSARRADRVGRGVRNRILGASLRRRRDLSRDGPHRDRRRRKRQLLVALDDEPLFSPDRA